MMLSTWTFATHLAPSDAILYMRRYLPGRRPHSVRWLPRLDSLGRPRRFAVRTPARTVTSTEFNLTASESIVGAPGRRVSPVPRTIP